MDKIDEEQGAEAQSKQQNNTQKFERIGMWTRDLTEVLARFHSI